MKNIIVLIISVIFLSISCNNATRPSSIDADKINKEPINLGDRVGTYEGYFTPHRDTEKFATLTITSNNININININIINVTGDPNPKKMTKDILASETNNTIELSSLSISFRNYIEFSLKSTNEATYKEIRNRDDKLTGICTLKRI